LWSSFRHGKLLSATTLGGRFSSFGEQLFGAALENNFGERIWGTTLWSSFGEQLWETGAASNASFEKPQLWSSFGN